MYRQSDEMFNEAQNQSAARFAPFEYASAEAYLKEALSQLEESDFKTSVLYSQKSQEFSKAAIEKSRQQRSQPVEKTQ